MVKFLKEGNVRIRIDDDGEVSVKINEDNIKESIAYIQEHQINNVDLSYELDQVDFLSECPDIEMVSLGGEDLKDVSGLYHLKNLKSLSINETRPSLEIDFERIPALEVLYGQLPPKAKGIGTLVSLKEMRLWSYKPKTKNLEQFSGLKNLETLELIQSNITSLLGVEGLETLEKLGLFYLRSFNDLKNIKYLTNSLRVLEIENCKKIGDFTPIAELKGLGKLFLMDCGELASIQFINQLPQLKLLAFGGTTVLDGNLYPCERIEEVYFTQKKHYTHRLKEYTAVRKENIEILSVPQSNGLMPTVLWRERMEEGDDMFSEEAIVASEKALQKYVSSLKTLKTPTEKAILKKVKEVVIEFNKLNEEFDYFIETLEREELCEFIEEKAQEAGLEPDEDITEEWREW
ncbi:hypothetical protein M3172_19840 [Mesobacillus subterraneus]|nr:hypothetical protein [Mesobacillus subterraneus]MCM3575457.1 hypothetical protein [Mesobacillus subterraneus]